jgi:hypothetical protein
VRGRIDEQKCPFELRAGRWGHVRAPAYPHGRRWLIREVICGADRHHDSKCQRRRDPRGASMDS